MRSSENWDEVARERLREQFGVEELPGRVVERARGLWLTTADFVPEGVKVHSVGIRLFYLHNRGMKPASFGLSFLGEWIRKRRVEVTLEELEKLLLGQAVEKPTAPEGYVALTYRGDVIGCGKVKEGKLSAEISKARRQELLSALPWEKRQEGGAHHSS
ncbi:tRNA pseudouridine(55) synthase TruB [Candidatus Bipolaricaulota sp. J31]